MPKNFAKKCLVVIVMCTSIPSYAAKPLKQKKHVIGCMPLGLFANFGMVLSNLAWCVRNNALPVVLWTEHCLYYTGNEYNGSLNAWEYYFQPLSQASYKGETVHTQYVAPDNSWINITFQPHNQPTKAERKKIYETLIKPFIKLNPLVQEKVDSFFDARMRGRHTIGIHLRGTDKIKETKLVDPLTILQEAQRHAGPHSQFFIATDEEALLELAVQTLPGTIIAYDSHRSQDGSPVHHDSPYPMHLIGEEVVIEAMLLARCNIMIHTDLSNVSGAVLFLNPDLENSMLMAF